MNKIVKRVLNIFCILAFICLGAVTLNYVANENVIAKYNDHKYQINNLTILGVTEPYIIHYNNGNVYYAKGQYDKAIEEYKIALSYDVPEKRECDIRVNLALAMVTPLDIDGISTRDELNDVLDVLYDAVDVLCEKGCAGVSKKGHDKEAQKLKNEIEDLIEQLENAQGGSGEGEGEGEGEGGSGPSTIHEGNPIVNPDKEDELIDLSGEALSDRFGTTENTYGIDDLNIFDLDAGPNW